MLDSKVSPIFFLKGIGEKGANYWKRNVFWWKKGGGMFG